MNRDIRHSTGGLFIVMGVAAGLPTEPWWRIVMVSVLIWAGVRLLR